MATSTINPAPSIESSKQPENPDEAPTPDKAASPMSDNPSSQTGSRSASPTTSKANTTLTDPPNLPSEPIPPLPNEQLPPPLPDEAPPADDGWAPVWDDTTQAFYFYNRFTQATQWENPRVPDATTPAAPGIGSHDRIPSSSGAPGTTSGTPGTASGAPPGIPSSSSGAPGTSSPPRRVHGGYNPAIHGDYDPTADYALEAQKEEEEAAAAARATAALDPSQAAYAATGFFNRFTGRWQAAALNTETFNDENKSKRQMSAFFDVDAAANSHDGRSLKAERQGKKLSKQEIKAFQQKRREKKEEKRRAWLRD